MPWPSKTAIPRPKTYKGFVSVESLQHDHTVTGETFDGVNLPALPERLQARTTFELLEPKADALTGTYRHERTISPPPTHVTKFDEVGAVSRVIPISASRPTLLWHLTSLNAELWRAWEDHKQEVVKAPRIQSGQDTTPWKNYQADVAAFQKGWRGYSQRYHYGSDVQRGPTRLIPREAWWHYPPSHVYAWKGPPARIGEWKHAGEWITDQEGSFIHTRYEAWGP